MADVKPWTYESLRSRRDRELGAHAALVQTAAPAILHPGSLEAIQAARAVSEAAQGPKKLGPSPLQKRIADSVRQTMAADDDDRNPVEEILHQGAEAFRAIVPQQARDVAGRGLRAATSGESLVNELGELAGQEGLGTRARKGIERIPLVGRTLATVADVAAAPVTWATAGYGGAAAASLRAGGGLAGRAAAGLVEPLVAGGTLSNVGAQVAAGAGASAAGQAAEAVLPEDAPMALRIGAQVAASLAGGVGGVTAFRGLRPAAARAAAEGGLRSERGSVDLTPEERAAKMDELGRAMGATTPEERAALEQRRAQGEIPPEPVGTEEALRRARMEEHVGNAIGQGPRSGPTPSIQGGAPFASGLDYTIAMPVEPELVAGTVRSAAAQNAARSAAHAGTKLGNQMVQDFEQAAEVVRQDRQGAVGTFLDKVKPLKGIRDVLAPGRNLSDGVLETWVASGSAGAKFRQIAYSSEQRFVTQIEQAFGAGTAAGAPSPSVRFIGTPEQAAVRTAAGKPVTGTVADIAENPELYDLTAAEARAIAFKSQTDDELRDFANAGYGLEIDRAEIKPGGAYIRRRDVSPEAAAAEDAGAVSRGITASGKSKDRGYLTTRDRLAADPRFEPDSDIRRLVREQHEETAAAIEAATLHAGLGGMTYVEAITKANPHLQAGYAGLHKKLEALRDVAGRLDERVHATVRRFIDEPAIQRPLAEGPQVVTTPGAEQLVARGGMIDTGRLPEYESLVAEIGTLRDGLRRSATTGEVLRNKPNNAAMQRIGELEALADVRGYLDQADGDIYAALDLIQQQNDNLGNALAAREDTGLRASLRNERPGDKRAGRQTNANTMRSASGAGVDRYGAVIGAGEGGADEYAILSARSQVLDTFMQETTFDVSVGEAVTEYLGSPQTPDDLETLRRVLDVRVGPGGRNAGATRDDLKAAIVDTRAELAAVSKARQTAQLRDPASGEHFVQVTDGLYRYFPAAEAKQVKTLLKRADNPLVNAAAAINATVLSGDISPWTNQGMLAFLADPVATAKQVYGGLRAGQAEGDWMKYLRRDALAEKIAADPQGWAEYAADIGMPIRFGTGVPDEFAGGLIGSLPKVAEKLGAAPGGRAAGAAASVSAKFNALNEGLFAGLHQRGKSMYDDTIRDLMAAGASKSEARAAAADLLGKVIPAVNTRRTGQSAAQAMAMRAPFTSVSFIRQPAVLLGEASKGLAKYAGKAGGAQVELTLKERLALKTVGRMAATAGSLAASTAAADALARGNDPVQAAIDAVNPGSATFLSVYLPGSGTRIPLGGPYRAIIRALMPDDVEVGGGLGTVTMPGAGIPRFLQARVQPTLRTQLDVVRNRDFSGNKIATQGGALGLLEVLGYEALSSAPIGAAAVAGTAATAAGGRLPGQQPATLNESIQRSVGQFLGVNAAPKSATERLNEVTPGRDFWAAEPRIREQVKVEHPDLWAQSVAAGSEPRQQAEVVRLRLRQQQEASDQQVLAGEITVDAWKKERSSRQAEQRGALSQVYGDRPLTEADANSGDALKKFYYHVQQAENPKTGTVDWDAVDRVRARSFTATENAYIDANVGASATPLGKAYRRALDGYYALPKYGGYTGDEGAAIDQLVESARTQAGAGNNPAKALKALRERHADADPKALAGARRAILGTLTVTTDRKRYLREHPDAAFLLGARVDQAKAVAALKAGVA